MIFVFLFLSYFTLILAPVTNVAMNTGVHVSLWDSDFTPLDIYPEVGFTESLGSSIFNLFGETSILFSIVAELIYIPINSIEGSPFLHILINNCFQLLTIAIPVDGRWYIFALICSFLMITDYEHLFMYMLTICIFFEKCLFISFSPFWN